MTAAAREPAWGGTGGGSPATIPPVYSLDDFAVVGDLFVRGGSPWFDVRAFGATGDGLTDDTAAIQAAINAALAQAGGGTVYLPGGAYAVTALTITHTSGSQVCNIIGSTKEGSYLKKTGGTTTPVLDIVNSSGSIFTHSLYSGFRILGNAKAHHGIRLTTTSFVILDNLDISACDRGIDLNGVISSQVRNCIAIGCNVGLRGTNSGGIDCNFNEISRCAFLSNSSRGIDLEHGQSWYVRGCDLEANGGASDTTTGGFYVGSSLGGAGGGNLITVEGCWFESNKGWTFQAHDGDVIVRDCYFFNPEGGPPSRALWYDGAKSVRLDNVYATNNSGEVRVQTAALLLLHNVKCNTLTNTAVHTLATSIEAGGETGDFLQIGEHGADVVAPTTNNVKLYAKDDGGGNTVFAARFNTGAVVPLATQAGDYGTAFPSNPVDGQQFTLVDSITNPTYSWRFRYNAGSANTDKWEFIGGAVASAEVLTDETTTSTTYADLATAGPSITVPRAGVYEIFFAADLRQTVGGTNPVLAAPKLGAATASDNDSVQVTPTAISLSWGVARAIVRTLAASDVVKLQYRTTAGTASIRRRNLSVQPVRLS